MLVKMNKKPIVVDDDDKNEKEKTITYFVVSSVGYVLALWVMDMVCYTFFYTHPFPFLMWLVKGVSGWIHLFGGMF